jgi:uncharacterized membrane protein
MVAKQVKRWGFLRWLRRSLLTGLLVLLPVVVTVWVLYRFFRWVDGFLKPIAARYPIIDIPGLGFLGVILIILLAGAVGGNFFGRRMFRWIEGGLDRIPMVRTLYNAIKQTSEVFLKQDRTMFKEVVLVQYPRIGVYTLGLVTSTWRFSGVDGREREYVSVFLPTTPNPTTGLFVMVPREEVVPSDLSVEDALKMAISGGAVVPEGHRRAAEELPGGPGGG